MQERREEVDKWWRRRMWQAELEEMRGLAGRNGALGRRKST